MSDDLIKRLLAEETDLTDCAADRIEQVEARNKELTLQLLSTSGQAADALDKLAKAAEALAQAEQIITLCTKETSWRLWGEGAVNNIGIVLAELEGKE